jgi:hypothetical protein
LFCAQTRAVKAIADSGEFGCVADLVVYRHLEQLASHPVCGFFNA